MTRAPILMAVCVGALGALALPATPARATVNQGLLELENGKAACRAKRFEAGLKQILKSAMTLQRANPRHPANRRWLPQARICLRAWVHHVSLQCRRQGQVALLRTLHRIEKKVKYLAVPVVKRLVRRSMPRCAAQIVKLRVKACVADSGRAAIARLETLRKNLAHLGVKGRTLGRLNKGVVKCALRWVQDADSRCRTDASVRNLKEIGAGIGLIPTASRARARAAYEACAKAIGRRAWSICQARRYRQGRALLKEAVNRYGFYAARDRKFLARMKRSWLPRCGSWYATGYFTARVKRGRLRLKIAARVGIEVARDRRGNRLLGEMRVRYSEVNGVRRGCRVLITPTDGRYSLQGSINSGARSMGLLLEKGMPQTHGTEEIQVTCGAGTPDINKSHLLHRLLARAGLLSLSLPARDGARKAFRWRGALPRGAQGSIAGTLTVKRLR